jgi:uncharacterized membrane protein (UPF0127 family)
LRVWNETRSVSLGDDIRVAESSHDRRTGLLNRSGLSSGEGLWIVPCEAIHTFRMKFPIDVAFLSRDRRIVKVKPGLRNGRIALCLRAHSVLELPSGTLQETRTAPGDRLRFDRV